MTQKSKYFSILSIWAVVLMLLPKINFWLSNNDFDIKLLNGSTESFYYVNWLLTYRYITPIAFSLSWLILVTNYEFKKWIYPLLVYSLVGIIITFVSAGKGYSWLTDLSFLITTGLIFFDYKKTVIAVFLIFTISVIIAIEWYITLLKQY